MTNITEYYSSDESDCSIERNMNRVNINKSNSTKTINLVSFGFSNGKPKQYDKDTDVMISVKDMFSVEKKLRDSYDGTAEELQKALMNMEANKDRYDNILEQTKTQIMEMLNEDLDEMTTEEVA